jgi:hypothetical protein
MGAKEGKAHLISLLNDAGASGTFAGHGNRTTLHIGCSYALPHLGGPLPYRQARNNAWVRALAARLTTLPDQRTIGPDHRGAMVIIPLPAPPFAGFFSEPKPAPASSCKPNRRVGKAGRRQAIAYCSG